MTDYIMNEPPVKKIPQFNSKTFTEELMESFSSHEDQFLQGMGDTLYKMNEELDKIVIEEPETKPKPAFKVGDVVRLKSGGPLMTVTKIITIYDCIFTKFFDNQNHLNDAQFGSETIDKIDIKYFGNSSNTVHRLGNNSNTVFRPYDGFAL